eukprot:TRINITY_DN369_c0_g1_i1.p1 TRINITY_DN369_c0_g1~~TRINITY_DN369_c0_g1_i1.p1  ORF type:complete len:180 (-),score=48.57 TRINITY_DN369_c0_g1_i1:73-543(-)
MKKDMGESMGNVIGKMLSIMGQNPEDILTEDEINKLLYETFKKFDKDGSGKLEKPEFHKAWEFLGLKATPDEINRSFEKVDVDASGLVDRYEFANAIKGSRLAELSLSVLITNMDGKLEGMESFFENYKKRLAESQELAAANLDLTTRRTLPSSKN